MVSYGEIPAGQVYLTGRDCGFTSFPGAHNSVPTGRLWSKAKWCWNRFSWNHLLGFIDSL